MKVHYRAIIGLTLCGLVAMPGPGFETESLAAEGDRTPSQGRERSHDTPENMPDGVIGVSMQVTAEHIGEPARLYVAHVHPEGPARQGGIKHGDEVLSVNGGPVDGKTYEQVVRMVRGEPGTTVKMQIKSEGNQRELSIIRVPSGTLYKAPMGSHDAPAK